MSFKPSWKIQRSSHYYYHQIRTCYIFGVAYSSSYPWVPSWWDDSNYLFGSPNYCPKLIISICQHCVVDYTKNICFNHSWGRFNRRCARDHQGSKQTTNLPLNLTLVSIANYVLVGITLLLVAYNAFSSHSTLQKLFSKTNLAPIWYGILTQ